MEHADLVEILHKAAHGEALKLTAQREFVDKEHLCQVIKAELLEIVVVHLQRDLSNLGFALRSYIFALMPEG